MSGFLTTVAQSVSAEEVTKNTIGSYLLDLQAFAEWFAVTDRER
jgi:hypothetical protein